MPEKGLTIFELAISSAISDVLRLCHTARAMRIMSAMIKCQHCGSVYLVLSAFTDSAAHDNSAGEPRNSARPVSISQSVTPSEYRSERISTPISANCSGLANSGVPAKTPGIDIAVNRQVVVYVARIHE